MPTFGLVTVLYNSADMLSGFFSSLDAQDRKDFALYAIDNASADDSVAAFRSLAASSAFPCELVENKTNAGVAAANNQGIAMALEAGCDYVALLNNDIEFPGDTLSRLHAAAERSGCDMVAPKVKYHDTGKIWFAGGGFSAFKGISVHWHHAEDLAAYGLAQREIAYAPTCFVLVRRGVFEDVGLMDERYFVYFDDTDFMRRAKRAGKRILYLPEPLISHKASASTGGTMSDFSIRFLARNRILFLRKSYAWPRRILYYSVYFLTLAAKSIRFDERQRKLLAKAVKEGFALSGPTRTAGKGA